MALKFPFTSNPIPEDVVEEKKKFFAAGSAELEYYEFHPNVKFCLTKDYAERTAEKIYNFKLRPDDIWIVTFPKCGTTWTQEIVWNIVHNVDKEAGKKELFERTPFLEFESITYREPSPTDPEKAALHNKVNMHSIDYADSLPSPRVIKTHLPLCMLPPKLLDTCKVVYVCRNPKDCCVSYYHHYKLLEDLFHATCTMDEFAALFRKDQLMYGGYFSHLKDAWPHRNHPNMKFLWYEDMKKGLVPILKDLSQFLGYPLTEAKVLELENHVQIDNMRKFKVDNAKEDRDKEKLTKFLRKGQVGDSKNHFKDEEAQNVWTRYITENTVGFEEIRDLLLKF